MKKQIFLIGLGSQGTTWAEILKLRGWDVQVFLPNGSLSAGRARSRGFQTYTIDELSEALQRDCGTPETFAHPPAIAFLCPDGEIGNIYRTHLAALSFPLHLILAHGYTLYAGDLKPIHSSHAITLLAPKAIGPKLLAAFRRAMEENLVYHELKAAFCPNPKLEKQAELLAEALGFSIKNLVKVSPELEAVGDLISEQGLLCGTVFTFLEWTLEAMAKAGVPDRLIREECFTELELVAGMLRERGPLQTFEAISQAAQSGTLAMRERMLNSGAKEAFLSQVEEIVSRKFAQSLGEESKAPVQWPNPAHDEKRRFLKSLQTWEERLFKKE